MSVQCERLSLVIVREMSSVMIERTTLWNCRLEGGDNSSLGELALFCIFVFFSLWVHCRLRTRRLRISSFNHVFMF